MIKIKDYSYISNYKDLEEFAKSEGFDSIKELEEATKFVPLTDIIGETIKLTGGRFFLFIEDEDWYYNEVGTDFNSSGRA